MPRLQGRVRPPHAATSITASVEHFVGITTPSMSPQSISRLRGANAFHVAQFPRFFRHIITARHAMCMMMFISHGNISQQSMRASVLLPAGTFA